MKKNSIAQRLCRAGAISALYVALTYAFMPFAFGPFQFRPAEALCLLPLFFPEAIPALYVGCMLSNLASPFLIYDVFIGSLATLLAALVTYLVGRLIKNTWLKIAIGGLAPILLNAFLIPLIIVFLCDGGVGYETQTIAYFSYVFSLFSTECVWVYALGTPLYFFIEKQKRRFKFFS
jgi:uncharacterized membrane protein